LRRGDGKKQPTIAQTHINVPPEKHPVKTRIVETHIFFLLGSGLGNTQIANSLNLSVKTIESHRENIKHKLDLSCSRDLVACAKKYVEVTFVPPTNIASGSKKKVVRFPAA
jgi:DNA-binding NarL/FixJ family response regulator